MRSRIDENLLNKLQCENNLKNQVSKFNSNKY